MISEPDFTSRVEKMIASGVDEREAPVRAILEYGTEAGRITEEEKDVAITTLQSFLAAHPGFSFSSPREKYRASHKNGEKDKNGGREGAEESNENSGAENSAAEEEDELWSTIQPILDRAQ